MFFIRVVVDRGAAVQLPSLRRIHIPLDMLDRDTTLSAFCDDDGEFSLTSTGEFAHGGNICEISGGPSPLSHDLGPFSAEGLRFLQVLPSVITPPASSEEHVISVLRRSPIGAPLGGSACPS